MSGFSALSSGVRAVRRFAGLARAAGAFSAQAQLAAKPAPPPTAPFSVFEAQEGRLFGPLAFTKTYAMAAAAGLSVTLVPVLMGYWIRGRIPKENAIVLNRFFVAGLIPVMLSTGTGSEIMQRIAAPMVGGMLTAPLLSMFVIPAAVKLMRRRKAANAGAIATAAGSAA